MKLYFIFLVSIILFVIGCGPAFLPGPTKKTVNVVDLVGTWQYPANYGETEVTLELKENGTFIQTIRKSTGGIPRTYTGMWKLDGVRPQITLLKPVFGKYDKPWTLEKVNWWVMDSVVNDKTEFSICGAADDRDPDSCFEMKKLR
jgi:hypothetical protein